MAAGFTVYYESFYRLTLAERHRLDRLTKHLRTIHQVTDALREPHIERPHGIVITTPEREDQPDSSKSHDVAIYLHRSETADIWVTIYPSNKVDIHYQAEPVRESGKPYI